MHFEKFIDTCMAYLSSKLGISLSKIKDINDDTLLCDSCNNFYGYYGVYKDYRLSIMYYEEYIGYNYPVVMTIDEISENIGFFEYLAEANKNDFSSIDLDKAYKIIDKFVENLENE